ncbi:MAG: YitT family protein [Mycobacteriales bacterium]
MQSTSRLADLGPAAQLRAGRLPRRLTQLFAGLLLYGVSMGLMIRGGLGLDPWDVFHFGVTRHLPLSFGAVVTLVGFVVLLAWIPLRQSPGFGTVANVLVIGVATDATLAVVPHPSSLALRLAFTLVGGVLLNGLAGAMYIGAQLGPGPRDGLMTGISRRTGLSIRLVRTVQEVTVVVVGFGLGGSVGLGTVAYALGIGPLVHQLLPRLVVPVDPPGRTVPNCCDLPHLPAVTPCL